MIVMHISLFADKLPNNRQVRGSWSWSDPESEWELKWNKFFTLPIVENLSILWIILVWRTVVKMSIQLWNSWVLEFSILYSCNLCLLWWTWKTYLLKVMWNQVYAIFRCKCTIITFLAYRQCSLHMILVFPVRVRIKSVHK